MSKDFVHPKLNEEVTAIAGHYTNEREERLTVNGKEVLYVVGYGVVDTSCCGMGGCRFAIVPGYILDYKYREDEGGNPVSSVEPIREDDEARREIIRLIEGKETYLSVRFL